MVMADGMLIGAGFLVSLALGMGLVLRGTV